MLARWVRKLRAGWRRRKIRQIRRLGFFRQSATDAEVERFVWGDNIAYKPERG